MQTVLESSIKNCYRLPKDNLGSSGRYVKSVDHYLPVVSESLGGVLDKGTQTKQEMRSHQIVEGFGAADQPGKGARNKLIEWGQDQQPAFLTLRRRRGPALDGVSLEDLTPPRC